MQERPDEVLVPWPPTPAVWTVPRLEAPPTSASGILELAQELQADGPWTANPTSERFLAGLVRADATARAAVLQELAGIHEETPVHGLDLVPALHSTPYTPRHDRVGELAEHLDQVTELVSTPTWVDHRLDPEDLVARLESLQRAGGVVLRSDLHLALRRLDLRAPDHDLAVRLRELDVPVICGADKVPDLTAGALAAAIADEPLIEPPLEDGGAGILAHRRPARRDHRGGAATSDTASCRIGGPRRSESVVGRGADIPPGLRGLLGSGLRHDAAGATRRTVRSGRRHGDDRRTA